MSAGMRLSQCWSRGASTAIDSTHRGGGGTDTVVRNELIVAVGMEDVMVMPRSCWVRGARVSGVLIKRERSPRVCRKDDNAHRCNQRVPGPQKDGRNVRVEYRFPKVLDAGAGDGSWAVGVARRHGANVGECLQHRKSALALATGIAAGNWAGDQSQRAKVQVLAFPS